MIPDIYEVNKIKNGVIYVMPKPSSEWLEDDAKYISGIGVDVVISILEKAEEFELGLQQERAEVDPLSHS